MALRVASGDDERHDRAPEALGVLMAKPERDLPAPDFTVTLLSVNPSF